MSLTAVVRGALLVVVVVLIAGGVLFWRGLVHLPVRTASAEAPTPKASRKPFVPPANAPKFDPKSDPDAIDPFVTRLAEVNALAHKQIVTYAEYEDTDGGQRYFLAVVTSCKDLDALWPIKSGALVQKVEGPLQLKDDFSIFSFAEYYSNGQWGVQSCDGTT